MGKSAKSISEFLGQVRPLRKYLHLIELFGSYARGDQRESSDIDLLVVLKDNKYRDQVLAAADSAMAAVGYQELLSPVIMDLKHYTKIKKLNSDFYYFINKEGKTLWKTKT